MAIETLPDWRSDWLYGLVFQRTEEAWERCDPAAPDRRFVLVEEYSETRGASCCGSVVRAWIRDATGLRRIALAEDEQLMADLGDTPFFPFIIVEFHILPDRGRVVLSQSESPMSGRSGRYRVIGAGEAASLEFDPSGGFSMS